ncbi:hypothetical protein L7F22_055380 [Adiantum nelumboides]|nr:hypothetical protein [Adiantum nelumboides]
MATSGLQATHSLRFLITGGGRGLGRGLARQLIQEGHDVFVVDIDAKELQHTLNKHLPSSSASSSAAGPGKFAGAECDVSSLTSVRAAIDKAGRFHRGGKVDVVVNNASRTNPYWSHGASTSRLHSDSSDRDGDRDGDGDGGESIIEREWRSFVDTNLTGTFHVSRASVPLLDGGVLPSIVNISSTRAKMSEPDQEGYASTKAGILGLTHSMAASLAPKGIRVNAILPGWIPSSHESIAGDADATPHNDGLTTADEEQHWSGAVGTVEDLKNAVLFLATTRFADGAEICLDGGMTKKMIYVEE